MNVLDWGVVVAYFLGLLTTAVIIGRRQKNLRDFYLHDNKIRWWESGLSTMATQLGAISFVSAPAFVALADDGGLKWLCYELGVPVGLLIVMTLILPVLHKHRYLSIYEYLEKRFDRRVRLQIAILFQLGRALATAVSILAGGLIVSTALNIATQTAILAVGTLTILYAVIGGMRAVVLSDVVQMAVVFIGILICGGLAVHVVGWQQGWDSLEPARYLILNFKDAGFHKDETYGFWPMLIGGIFLYASYYGCDQSQVQRELSVGTLKDARKSLVLNATLRFPVVLLYCVMGVFVGSELLAPAGMEHAASQMGIARETLSSTLATEPDRMLPIFVLSYLPHGLIGMIFVAILSALMSSMDSAINSLSAVTVRDIYQVYVKPNASDTHYLRIVTILWGLFCMTAALAMYALSKSTRETTIVLINAVGSLLYGPILATFLLGIKGRFADSRSVSFGIWFGIAVNACIWIFTDVSWLWWNVIGFATVVAVSVLLSWRRITKNTVELDIVDPDTKLKQRSTHLLLGIYAILIVLFCFVLQQRLAG
jgi:SSS family transporter